MQRNVLNAAVLAAVAAMAGQAQAGVAPTSITSGNTAVSYISGSSATNNQLIGFARKACTSGTLTHIKTSDSNHFALLCQPSAAMGTYSKTNVLIVKNSTGGSGNGVGPVASADASWPFIDVFNTTWEASCGTVTAKPAITEYSDPTDTTSATQIALPGYDERTCALTTVGHVPDMGISDEEPAVLVAAGSVTATPDQVASLTADPLNIVTFGVGVTTALRDALQTQQIANGALPGNCTAGNETEACMPSLTKASVASIYTGNLVGWSELGLAPADDQVYIARRPVSSGTETAHRVFFLNDPCSVGVTPMLDANNGEGDKAANACSAASYAPGANVYTGSGGGDVENCLHNHNTKGRFAIGVVGIENPGTGTSHAAAMRHVKIDGISPTAINVSNGRYGFWVESTLNYTSVAGDVATMKDALLTAFNDPVVVRSVNTGFNATTLLSSAAEPWTAGIVAPAGSGTPPNITTGTLQDKLKAIYLNPTSSMTHGGNTCQPAYTYHAVGTSGNQP
ncbi:MAG: hypothetical protein ABIK08_00205 [Pseudomonadota bacterium]